MWEDLYCFMSEDTWIPVSPQCTEGSTIACPPLLQYPMVLDMATVPHLASL